jgi:hypothetical protein
VPVGVPKIISCPRVEHKTGEYAYIQVTVQNVGQGKGTFAFSLSCPSGISVAEPSKTVQFAAGETKTVTLRITGYTSLTEEHRYCTVNVYDVERPDKIESCKAEVVTKKLLECEPEGARECYGEATVRVCKDGEWKYYACGADEICKNGQCVKKSLPSPPPECEWWDIACHVRKFVDWVKETTTRALIMIGAIVVIILIAFIVIKILETKGYKVPKIPKVG